MGHALNHSSLSPRCVEVCRLRYLEREKVSAIAGKLGMCHQRVSQHLHVARKRCAAIAMMDAHIFGRKPRSKREALASIA